MVVVENVVHQLITLTVGLAFGSVIAYAKLTSKQNKAIRIAVRTLLKSQVNAEWRRLTERGFVYVHELELVKDMYARYVDLNGNSNTHLLVEDIDKLERRPSPNFS